MFWRRCSPLVGALCTALAMCVGCPDENDDDSDPGYGEGDGELHAAFEASPPQVYVAETIHFDAGTSVDAYGIESYYSDCEIVEFRWDFGDGDVQTTDLYFVDHPYDTVGTFTVSLTTVTEAGGQDSVSGEVSVLHPLPVVHEVDVSVDGAAIIGEWIRVIGENFRVENTPSFVFGGGPAAIQTQFVDDTEIQVRVPPKSPSGTQGLDIDFPEDDGGDTTELIWIKRYAVATDAFHDWVSFLSFGDGTEYLLENQGLNVEDATLVKITGDGATAIIGDGRWDINLTPTLVFVDLTSDFFPVITNITTDIGVGPLFDIATAIDIAVVADAIGLNVIDLTDPYDPLDLGREDYPFEDMAATDVELTPDGELAVVLGTFDDSVRFYEVGFSGATLLPYELPAGAGIQDLQITEDGQFAYILSGGGEGAIPPDLDLGNTCVTIIDLAVQPPLNFLGDDQCVAITEHAPIPFDLTIARDGTTYISSFDQNFAIVSQAFGDIIGDPLDINAWIDLIDALGGLSFGGVVAVDNLFAGNPLVGDSWFLPYGFQTGLQVRFDEQLYVSTGIYLDFVASTENPLDIFAAITMTNGMVVANLINGQVDDVITGMDPLLYYENLQLDYDYQPLLNLVLPPYSFGDVAIQP